MEKSEEKLTEFYKGMIAQMFKSFSTIFKYTRNDRYDDVLADLKQDILNTIANNKEEYHKALALRDVLLSEKYSEVYDYAIRVWKSQKSKRNKIVALIQERRKCNNKNKKLTPLFIYVDGKLEDIAVMLPFKSELKSIYDCVNNKILALKHKYADDEYVKKYWLIDYSVNDETENYYICINLKRL